MLAMSSPRRLLVVDPCADCHELLPGLRTIGWAVDSCTLATVVDRSCDVGLFRLQPFHLQRPEVRVIRLLFERRRMLEQQ